MKKILLVLSIAVFFTAVSSIPDHAETINAFITKTAAKIGVSEQRAAIFFVPGVTANELQGKYVKVPETRQKVHVLVMPGHEPGYGGAEYRDLKEREMNVEVAGYLAGFLKGNTHFEVVVPRTNAEWNEPFASYFKNASSSIKDFNLRQKDEMARLIKAGALKRQSDTIYHNDAPTDVALRIFGINKWANENKVDVSIHIHFNDYPRRSARNPGEYSGFTIYVPEKQYSNSNTTKAIADSLMKRLSHYYPTSNMPQETDGIVEDQDLIAIGSHNTSDAPSMLVEYGYIYEPQFQDSVSRSVILKDMAFQTYLGLQDFFGAGNDVTLSYDNLILPHKWTRILSKKSVAAAAAKGDSSIYEDVIALQTVFIREGLYPPLGETKTSCPRTGGFGPCTMKALGAFQKKYEIIGEDGYVGTKTINQLNKLYELQII
jgi:N-acetylmuramoyl-L-alanine amidase